MANTEEGKKERREEGLSSDSRSLLPDAVPAATDGPPAVTGNRAAGGHDNDNGSSEGGGAEPTESNPIMAVHGETTRKWDSEPAGAELPVMQALVAGNGKARRALGFEMDACLLGVKTPWAWVAEKLRDPKAEVSRGSMARVAALLEASNG